MVRRGRQAFTLIEILVVIGIILLLIGIGVIGYQHIDKVAGEKATKARFETCSSLLNEYELSTGSLIGIESKYGGPGVYSAGSPTAAVAPQITQPGDVNLGGAGRSDSTVTNTGLIFLGFSHVPSAKVTLSQLPPAAIMGGAITNTPNVVDAWKNPIIYVPSGGLTGVTVFTGTSQQRTVTVTSIDGRPFWASAGQDGNFSTGDDNLYSVAVIMK